MKRTGAWLTVYALEQIGARFTFGIPGVHTTELYDELNSSNRITQVLVTHEGGASFMADAVGRLSDSIGVLTVVPAAGLTHAASGIGEAFLDGVPMLVLSGGPRTDTGHRYQLHQMDTHKFMSGLTKATFRVTSHDDVVPTLFKAYEIATSGEPGPVFVELPVNVLLLTEEIGELPQFKPLPAPRVEAASEIARAAELLTSARHPCIFAGWGTRDASVNSYGSPNGWRRRSQRPCRGYRSFPPIIRCMSVSVSAPPPCRRRRTPSSGCDGMIAIGTRFSEIATGSYGAVVPENLSISTSIPMSSTPTFRPGSQSRAMPARCWTTSERAGSEGTASHLTREPARADQKRQGRLSRELVPKRCRRYRQSRALLRRAQATDAGRRHHLHR